MGLGVSNASKVRPGGRLSLDGCGCPKSWLFFADVTKEWPLNNFEKCCSVATIPYLLWRSCLISHNSRRFAFVPFTAVKSKNSYTKVSKFEHLVFLRNFLTKVLRVSVYKNFFGESWLKTGFSQPERYLFTIKKPTRKY